VGAGAAAHRGRSMTLYLLDTTVLIGFLRGTPSIADDLRRKLAAGHMLATTCVNISEVERGLQPKERRRAAAFLDRLRFLVTGPQAARRAGGYQAVWVQRGRTLHAPDALIAGTARSHGAVVVTHNVADFPIRDVRVEEPRDAEQ
jgi:predicted nucleic acid-binding protein